MLPRCLETIDDGTNNCKDVTSYNRYKPSITHLAAFGEYWHGPCVAPLSCSGLSTNAESLGGSKLINPALSGLLGLCTRCGYHLPVSTCLLLQPGKDNKKQQENDNSKTACATIAHHKNSLHRFPRPEHLVHNAPTTAPIQPVQEQQSPVLRSSGSTT